MKTIKWPWVKRWRLEEKETQKKQLDAGILHAQAEARKARVEAIQSAKDSFEEGRKAGVEEGRQLGMSAPEKVVRMNFIAVASLAKRHREIVCRGPGGGGFVTPARELEYFNECQRTGAQLDQALGRLEEALMEREKARRAMEKARAN